MTPTDLRAKAVEEVARVYKMNPTVVRFGMEAETGTRYIGVMVELAERALRAEQDNAKLREVLIEVVEADTWKAARTAARAILSPEGRKV